MGDYGTMKDIGRDYGMTSHVLGKLLKQHGLRTEDGKPSAKAFEIEMVDQKFDGFGHYIWSWHIAKMKKLLERLGHEPKSDNAAT
jgi:hypothetical protein